MPRPLDVVQMHVRHERPHPLPAGAQRVHVRIGADARVAEQVPRAAHALTPLDDGVAEGRAVVLEVVLQALMPDHPAPTMTTSTCLGAAAGRSDGGAPVSGSVLVFGEVMEVPQALRGGPAQALLRSCEYH